MKDSSKELIKKIEDLCIKRKVDDTNVEKVLSEIFMRRLKETES